MMVARPTTVKTSGRDARRERWREHRQARRAEFVDTTVRALAKYGADVGMEEIAAEAGVSKPVLYRYFSDKADLYLAVGQWASDLMLGRMRPALDEPGSARQRIHRIIDTYLRTLEEHPALYRFIVWRTFVDGRVDSDPVADNKALISDAVSQLLSGYAQALGADTSGIDVFGHGLVGMVQSAGDLWLDRQEMRRDELSTYLTRLIWHAIDGFLRDAGFELDPDEPLENIVSIVDKGGAS